MKTFFRLLALLAIALAIPANSAEIKYFSLADSSG
jgi:hypothetical protein